MDIRRFKEYILEMEQQGMKVETYSDTSISGQITSREDGALLLTIPYETGWSLYVDGQEAEIIPFSNALISVPLTAGTHSIELKYQSEGLRTGIMITVISLALLLLLYCLRKLFTAWKQEKATASEAEKDKVAEIQLEQLEDKKE